MAQRLVSKSLAGSTGVQHGFFTRQGGMSEGIYASLNTGLGSGDDRAAVLDNRARVATALGVAGGSVVTVHQIHSAHAVVAEAPFDSHDLPKADAIVTRTPGLVVGALAADCAPVLLADAEAGVVAAAHAGWRGALGGIVEAAIACMEREGASRENIKAAVGPCINQEAYEVGPEFQEAFEAEDPANSRFFKTREAGGRPHFDLPEYVYHRLFSAGLADAEKLSPCTYENESDFFSYRRSTHKTEPDYGRHISAIVLTQR